MSARRRRLGPQAAALAVLCGCGEGAGSPGAGHWPSLEAGQPAPAAIVQGRPAAAELYPAVGVLLRWPATAGAAPAVVCGASMVDARVLVSAAHCWDDGRRRGREVLYFSRQADVSAGGIMPSDRVEVVEVAMHPGFDAGGHGSMLGLGQANDLALMRLREPIEAVPPLSWLPAEDGDRLQEGLAVTVVGWGKSRCRGGQAGRKHVADTRISALAAYEMQVGDGDGDGRKCYADSGAPTLLADDDPARPPMVIGIASHTYYDEQNCQHGHVDTRVDAYADWLASTLRMWQNQAP